MFMFMVLRLLWRCYNGCYREFIIIFGFWVGSIRGKIVNELREGMGFEYEFFLVVVVCFFLSFSFLWLVEKTSKRFTHYCNFHLEVFKSYRFQCNFFGKSNTKENFQWKTYDVSFKNTYTYRVCIVYINCEYLFIWLSLNVMFKIT